MNRLIEALFITKLIDKIKIKIWNYLFIIRHRSNVENCYYEYCKTFLANIHGAFVSSNKYKRHIDFREIVLLEPEQAMGTEPVYGRFSFI